MSDLSDYITLIEKFLNHEITVGQFESQYIDQFTEETRSMSEALFQSLDWLFSRVDAYTDLPFEPGDDPDDHINEDQLRISAAETLQELRSILK